LEALAEAIENEINETPPSPEESEVMAEITRTPHAGISPVLFT